MKLESPKVSLEKPAQEVFNFLTTVDNFKQLMPENISKFEVLDADKFLFALSGMPEIVLKKKSMEPPHTGFSKLGFKREVLHNLKFSA